MCHFWQAARDGKIDVIRQRLQKLEKNPARRLKVINKADEDSTTPLHYAVRYGHVEVVKLLVEFGAGKPDFNEYFYLACVADTANFSKKEDQASDQVGRG